MTPDYSPISYPYRPIRHKWAPEDVKDVTQQIHQRFILPTHTIPPPQNYIPRPAELPAMSLMESNIPDQYTESSLFGWKDSPEQYKQDARAIQQLGKEQMRQRLDKIRGNDRYQVGVDDGTIQYGEYDPDLHQTSQAPQALPPPKSHWKM